MTTEQKINELQAQLDALRAELDKPKRPMSLIDFTSDMDDNFNNKYYDAWFALRQLIILRDAWGGGCEGDGLHVNLQTNKTRYVLSFAFADQKTRDEFQAQFADLIKTASPLLG
jgi:hypothetical protein